MNNRSTLMNTTNAYEVGLGHPASASSCKLFTTILDKGCTLRYAEPLRDMMRQRSHTRTPESCTRALEHVGVHKHMRIHARCTNLWKAFGEEPGHDIRRSHNQNNTQTIKQPSPGIHAYTPRAINNGLPQGKTNAPSNI